MRVATWNVNSVKKRVSRLLPWLEERRPDVLCLQETKLTDKAFDELLGEELAARGYAIASHGEGQWNGVAILSRVGLEDVLAGIPGAPGFPHPEARAISAICAGVRVYSVYVPNGRTPDSDHYRYKLAWLRALRDMVAADAAPRISADAQANMATHPGPETSADPDNNDRIGSADLTAQVVVCGDMNIAPADIDVFDPDAYIGQTHVTPAERTALAELRDGLGLCDIVRERWPQERIFTYWDYRAGMFHQDLGMRIDLILASASLAGRVRAAWIDRQARKGAGPSDHAPVIVDLDEAPDGDIGPVVPPPSAPVLKRGARKLPASQRADVAGVDPGQ